MLVLCLVLLAGCDTVEPVEEGVLVVEGFVDAGEPLPEIRLRQTLPVTGTYPDDSTTAALGADVRVRLDGQEIRYRAVAGEAGRYAPAPEWEGVVAPPRASIELDVRWEAQHATASGGVPPPVALDEVVVTAPDAPVEAVLLDSLYFTDSLGVATQHGYIYPVEVTLSWTVDFDEVGADSLYWIQTRLRPYTAFSSPIVDFFLRSGQVLRERAIPRDAAGRRTWTGVYAVPVDGPDDPLPEHALRVALVRSDQAYARFASSRDAPVRREPLSNVRGAIGIFAGISVDSLTVRVP